MPNILSYMRKERLDMSVFNHKDLSKYFALKHRYLTLVLAFIFMPRLVLLSLVFLRLF